MTKAYGGQPVFRGLDLTLERGDRIAFLGSNGAGRSTLARILAGIEPIQAGTRTPGHNVGISYHAQHQADELDPKKTVLETLQDPAPAGLQQGLRQAPRLLPLHRRRRLQAGRGVSGGERSRLALAKMLLTPANLLVLDEPTNHLDIATKRALTRALADYSGTLVFVSHDRAFLRALATRVLELSAAGPRIYGGTYDEYVASTGREAPGMRA